MLGTSPRRPESTTARTSSGQPGPPRAEHRAHASTAAGPIAEAYGRFLELPVPVVLVVLWTIGLVLMGTVLGVAYLAVTWPATLLA